MQNLETSRTKLRNGHSQSKTTLFQTCIVLLLLLWTLKARLQRRKGNCETPASQSNHNSNCKSYLHEDYNPGEIRINFSRPHAYKRESNMDGIVGAPIRLKHNVPRPYHGPREISSMKAFKRQRKEQIKGGENRRTNRGIQKRRKNTAEDWTHKRENKSKKKKKKRKPKGKKNTKETKRELTREAEIKEQKRSWRKKGSQTQRMICQQPAPTDFHPNQVILFPPFHF